jgi:hypothetical protein
VAALDRLRSMALEPNASSMLPPPRWKVVPFEEKGPPPRSLESWTRAESNRRPHPCERTRREKTTVSTSWTFMWPGPLS